MQTNIIKTVLQTNIGQEANDILRSCVHCGFCTATCPTYQLLGDELDGPRGRIYLIKRVLETDQASKETQNHLDRCLSCGACETTCPSGVKYRRLLDIGREAVEQKVGRNLHTAFFRKALVRLLNNKPLFSILLRLAQSFRPLLPEKIKNKIPKKQTLHNIKASIHHRKMILFRGCVHDAISPDINASAINVLDKLGISVTEVSELNCCGAISHHLLDQLKTEITVKKNIDILHAKLSSDSSIEAIFTTASACSLMLKDYPVLMAENKEYYAKALDIVEKTNDISEIISAEPTHKLKFRPNHQHIAFHNPCSLQHGLKVTNHVENLLQTAGFTLTDVQNTHLCCGSAGTYSILQSKISKQLLTNKIASLTEGQPDIIATANIGCLTHLQSATKTPVKHWITLINKSLV